MTMTLVLKETCDSGFKGNLWLWLKREPRTLVLKGTYDSGFKGNL